MYKKKFKKDGIELKARICSNRNQNIEKQYICKNSTTVQYDFTRLAVSVAAVIGLDIAGGEIKVAYLRSSSMRQYIFEATDRVKSK